MHLFNLLTPNSSSNYNNSGVNPLIIVIGLLVIFISLAALASYISSRKTAKLIYQNKLTENQNKLTAKEPIDDYEPEEKDTIKGFISADFKSRKWRPEIFENCKTYDFSAIADFELVQNGVSTVSKGRLTGALVGGLVAGQVGAIIGSNTSKKQITTVNSMLVRITLINADLRIIEIPLYSGANLDTSGIAYNNYKSVAENILSLLQAITVSCERETATATTEQRATISSADEIRKFKQLLDDGIITESEFEEKKKQLLNL